MPHEPQDTDPNSWRRYFAIESNNRAWELAVQTSRTSEETIEMLNAAHAAALHWNVVGNELNHMRAKTLLAEAHALAGFGESALRLAEEIRTYFLSRETEDWEIATVYSIHAHSAACACDVEKHRDSYESAKAAVEKIADAEDRRIVLQTFNQVPSP